MCDYSLEFTASRPAAVGDKLVTTGFSQTITRGFAAAEDINTAVCLRPGTEIAFAKEVEYENPVTYARQRMPATVARFRHVNQEHPLAHHDALEFPNGETVLLTRLVERQYATVLQLPAAPRAAEDAALERTAEEIASI